MIEALWAALLVVALTNRESRPLALLLTAKWAVNYALFLFVAQPAPVLSDIAAGALGVMLASRTPTLWKDVVLAGFVLTPLAHAWYWLQHKGGTASPVVYYWLVIGLFTAQVCALAWPGGRAIAQSVFRWVGRRNRGRLAGDLGHASSRTDARGS